MNSMQPAKGSDCVEEQGGDTTSELFDIAERLLKEAQRQGADAAEVSVSDHTGLSVGVRLRGVESVEFTRDRSMALNVYIGGRRGMASTSDARTQTMVEIAGKALNFARHTESDPCNGLAEPALLATEFPDLDLFHPVPMDTESLKESALRAEAAALDADGRIVNSHGASSWQQAGSEVYANSHGFIGSSRGTQYGISVGVIATDEGGMKTDSWYTSGRVLQELDSPESVGREAAQRTLLRLGSRSVPTGSYQVLFDSQTAQGLLGCLLSALSGRLLYRNASFLSGSLGKQVAVSGLTVCQQPHLQRAAGSCAFDGEGVATRELRFIQDGAAASYVLDSYTGRKLGMSTTGNAGGVFNVVLHADATPKSELIKSIRSGLLVTELMGQGVDLVTGDYSRGASGLWIEGGETVHSVDEVTVAGNLKDVFLGIAGFGDDVDIRGNIRTGSILVESMTVAGG